jgi:methyltransferase family protein
MTESELLAHYVERGGEPWNVSLEAAWLDYELRAWFRPRLPQRWPAAVCNIGIGVGLWDDWLGHELGVAITSVDRDPQICRTFAARQRRERHPHPAHVCCGDICDGLLAQARFDAITIVGSTLAETGDRDQLLVAARARLALDGTLLVAEVGNREPPPADEVRRLGEMWIAFRQL